MMPEEDKKSKEWISLNRALVESYQICGFISATKDVGNESPIDLLRSTIMPSCQSYFNEFLLFCGNIFRVYGLTEINKIVNSDPQSVTLFSFINEFYPDKNSEEQKWFGKWKKDTKNTRDILRTARNEFASHLDKESFHSDKYFGLYLEDIEDMIKRTLEYFDFLYDNDIYLKNSFNSEINPGLSQKPSRVAETWRNIAIKRIESLKDCLKK